MINMHDQGELYPNLLKVLTDGISLHNATLRYLALLDDSDRGSFQQVNDLEGCRNSVYDTVMACPRLIQLELPMGWGSKEMNLKVCLFLKLKYTTSGNN